jgi:hypothetical protein
MRLPPVIRKVRDTILRAIPANQWKQQGPEYAHLPPVWKHWNLLMEFRFAPFKSWPEKRRRELAAHVGSFLRWLSPNPQCWKESPWKNLGFCPSTSPIGSYMCTWQLMVVQHIVWSSPDFLEGFRFGRKPTEPFRDANPYSDPGRSEAWDNGYILGITKPAALRQWLAAMDEALHNPNHAAFGATPSVS